MRLIHRAAILAASLLALVPTAAAAWKWFPEPHSPVAHQWDALFIKVLWPALVVFFLVEGLILYAIIRFRRRKDGPQEGPHIHGNTKMEIAWTIAPTLVMGWLLVVSLQALDRVDNGPTPDFEVDVVASQFQFQFLYPPNYDDSAAQTGELRVEAGKIVGLHVTSIDVIHALNIPSLGVMIDAVPGHRNYAWFQADQPGEYFVQCRELCGIGHGQMHAKVVVFAPGTQERPWGKNETAAPPAGNQTGGNQTNGTVPEGFTAKEMSLGPGFAISPVDIDAKPGDKIAFQVTNKDDKPHNFYFGNGFDTTKPDDGAMAKTETLSPGQSQTITVTLGPDQGNYEYWCDVPGHYGLGMHGGKPGATGGGKQPLLPGFETPLVLAGIVVASILTTRRRGA